MTKLIRIFVFSFVVFVIYISLEQLAFKNTILADSNVTCCNDAGYCQSKECSEPAQIRPFNSDEITCNQNIEELTTCRNCVSSMGDQGVCLPYGYDPIPYCLENGYKYYLGAYTIPEPPQGLVITESQDEHPVLNWSANGEPDLKEYNIYRKGGYPFVDWTVIGTTTSTTYKDYELTTTYSHGEDYYYKITAIVVSLRESGFSNTVWIEARFEKRSIDSNNKGVTELPQNTFLANNYPNPFNPMTIIHYGIAEQTFVKVVVYDILGKEVSLLVNEGKSKGKYKVMFDATGLPSGTYYYQIITDSFTDVKKMKLVK